MGGFFAKNTSLEIKFSKYNISAFNGLKQEMIVLLTFVESLTISVFKLVLKISHLLDIVSPSDYISCIFCYIRCWIYSLLNLFCLLIYSVQFLVSNSCSSSSICRVSLVVDVATFGINRFLWHQLLVNKTVYYFDIARSFILFFFSIYETPIQPLRSHTHTYDLSNRTVLKTIYIYCY